MKYPTEIWFGDGSVGIIFPGHGWTEAYCREMVREYSGYYEPCENMDGSAMFQKMHFNYRPRVKWCGSCDSDGDWHRHWEVVPASENLQTKFTVVYIES